MNSIAVLVILVVVFVSGFVNGTDYCSICSGSSHIACGNSGDFGSACPSERNMVEMTSELKDLILEEHNTKRDTIAAGNLPGFEPASRMATMQWNEELAKLAALNVKRCIYGHDQCRNTDEFKYSGQNLAKKWWSGMDPSDSSLISEQIDSWWDENKDTTMEQINKYPSSSSKTIGHFTVMAADRNIAVGCAAIKFPDKNMNSLTFACNYATTNMIGSPIYAAGAAGSKCKTGTNPNYSALCSPSEPYDVNAF